MWKFFPSLQKLLIFNGKKYFSTTSILKKRHCCKLLVVGGGSAGCTIAAKFRKVLNKHEIILIEPSAVHYFQPHFTLVGAGVARLRDIVKATVEVLPEDVTWLQDSAKVFCPHVNTIITKNEDIIVYDFMIVAVGLDLDLDQVQGLTEALNSFRNVCTIYSAKYVEKTFKCLKEFVSGEALFTAPNTPIKCLPASLKISFIAQDYFKREDKLFQTDITYITGQHKVFPVKEYEKKILEIAHRKRVDIHLRTNLVQVVPERNKAVFECLNNPGSKISMDYNLLHVTPPMSVPKDLKECKDLVDVNKYMNVDLHTMQHKKYSNIFAIGDCSSSGINKTVAAAATQALVVFKNLLNVMRGQKPVGFYDGYTSCPLVTGYGTAMLVEFNYKMERCESFPFNQTTERATVYYLKLYVMPQLYWGLILKGKYPGTERLQKIMKTLRIK